MYTHVLYTHVLHTQSVYTPTQPIIGHSILHSLPRYDYIVYPSDYYGDEGNRTAEVLPLSKQRTELRIDNEDYTKTRLQRLYRFFRLIFFH